MFLLTEQGLMSYIDLDPVKATRATVFHEWLHRYFALRRVTFESIGAEHAAIERFLQRHRAILRLE